MGADRLLAIEHRRWQHIRQPVKGLLADVKNGQSPAYRYQCRSLPHPRRVAMTRRLQIVANPFVRRGWFEPGSHRGVARVNAGIEPAVRRPDLGRTSNAAISACSGNHDRQRCRDPYALRVSFSSSTVNHALAAADFCGTPLKHRLLSERFNERGTDQATIRAHMDRSDWYRGDVHGRRRDTRVGIA